MKHIVKTDIYDSFRCTADQCDFTCCKGWSIILDDKTVDQWKKHKAIDAKRHMLQKKEAGDKDYMEYQINMGAEGCCPFFNQDNLCGLITMGEHELQPHTCEVYPRQLSEYDNAEEYSLSFGCPAVTDMVMSKKSKIYFLSDDEAFEIPKEDFHLDALKIRNTIIKIFQENDPAHMCGLEDKFLASLYLLNDILEEPQELPYLLKYYRNKKNTAEIYDSLSQMIPEFEDSLLERNELFMDIIAYYREEAYYKDFFLPLSDLAQELEENSEDEDYLCELKKKYQEFERQFAEQMDLLQRVFVSKIYARCNSDVITEFTEMFQMLIVEYVMIRHVVFLRSIEKDEIVIDEKEIRDSIIRFSRMIEYNLAGMKEFFEVSFDDAIWDIGYLLLLLK